MQLFAHLVGERKPEGHVDGLRAATRAEQHHREKPMRRNRPAVLIGGAALSVVVAGSSAQANCETIPAGPARTDCYIGLGRINRQKSEIAAGVARQQADTAIYRNVTGKRPKKKGYSAVPAR
jgi:hypothetical protein